MIINLKQFIGEQRPAWTRLEQILDLLEKNPDRRLTMEEVQEFHELYQRTSADLARIATFSTEQSLRLHLEALTARAYAEIYESRRTKRSLSLTGWFFHTFPQTFRKHIAAFWAALLITLAGCAFGGLALSLDPEAKEVIMPFSHVLMDPSERVAKEEAKTGDDMEGSYAYFSSFLMTNNIRVSIFAMALGMTFGLGTVAVLFYNGVILGAVAADYILAGESVFLAGWLLPHGSVEIHSILIAGQAGFVLASALLGRDSPLNVKQRLRNVSGDVITLVCGLALMLVWAGFIESFFSQHHEPAVPYWLKISFGGFQLALLILFLARSGKKSGDPGAEPDDAAKGAAI